METDQTYYQLRVLRVLRLKKEGRVFHDRIASVHDMRADRSERPIREPGPATEVFGRTHRHFRNYLGCRLILVRQALEDAGFKITDGEVAKRWGNVEIVRR
jgi:hypothetical protein